MSEGEAGCGVAPAPHRVLSISTNADGKEEIDFDSELALAALLLHEVVFLNSNWWEKEWPEAAKATFAVCVNCNDVFAWGCAEGECLEYKELQDLYEHWLKDPSWGSAVWCMKKRRQMPQRPVAKRIRDGGIWDLAIMGLRANHYDGVSRVTARRRYDAYCAWARGLGEEALPFDAEWWAGWRRFTDAVPDWHSPEWKAAEDDAIKQWRITNGFDHSSKGASPAVQGRVSPSSFAARRSAG